MTRFMKIFATLAGLTLMTACGNTQGLIDALTAAVSSTDRTAVACVQNPFNQLCDGNETYQSTRDAIERSCTDNPNTSDNCVNFVAFLCIRDNPYHRICTQGENDYSSVQEQITSECIRDGEGPLCDRAIAAVCTNNAFDRLCLTDLANEYNQGALVADGEDVIGFSAARARVCDPVTGSDPDSQQCGSFIRAVCDRNPLDAVCANRDEYFVARDHACWIQGIDGSTRTAQCAEIHRLNNLPANAIPACRANYVDPTNANRFNPRCYNVVIPICNDNPFDDICEENSNFTNRHAKIIIDCRAQEPDATFCAEAKTSVCADNPFDPLCFLDYTSSNHPTNNDYESERQTAVNDCQTTFVAGLRCLGAAEQFCRSATGEGLFNALCLNDPNTDAGRQPLCVSERVAIVTVGDNPITARCATTATRVCDARPLDPLCDGVDAYFDAQLSACVKSPEDPSCVVGGEFQFAALQDIAGCLATPFDAACLNINTPQGELFAPRAAAAQKTYCEAGTLDHVNCTNIGSSPVFADLARNITQNGITTYNANGDVTANGVTPQNPNIGGFLRTGVFGTRLGDHKGTNGATFTDENNNGNFDRGNDLGGAWTGLPADFGAGGPGRIFENNASKVDPNDGFTYFLAQDTPGFFLSYAGIWQTTNFGAPLAVRPADSSGNITAIWQGTFTPQTSGGVVQTLIEDGEPLAVPLYNPNTVQTRVRINDRTTDFYVDFTARTFNFYNKVAEDGTGIVFGYTFSGGTGSQREVPKKLNYSLNGVFGAGVTDPNDANRVLNAGELGGNVTFTIQPLKLSDGTNLGAAGPPIVMPLTGLIGVEGAVGVFLDPARTTSANVGGFTASAPAPTN